MRIHLTIESMPGVTQLDLLVGPNDVLDHTMKRVLTNVSFDVLVEKLQDLLEERGVEV